MRHMTDITSTHISIPTPPVHYDRLPDSSVTEKALVIAPLITSIAVCGAFHKLKMTELEQKTLFLILIICTVSVVTFGIAWMKRRRSDGFYRIRASDLNRIIKHSDHATCPPYSVSLVADNNKNIMKNKITPSLVNIYVLICVSVSRIIMTLGRVRMSQIFRDNASAAKGLTDEWAYELEQDDDPIKRAIDATYMLKSAGLITIRYGTIGRLFTRFFNRRCACGKKSHFCDCIHEHKTRELF